MHPVLFAQSWTWRLKILMVWQVCRAVLPGGWCCTHSHPEEPHDRFRTGHPKCRCVAKGSQHWQAETDALPDMDDAVATQPAQVPLPTWVDEESQGEYPRQRRRLQLISQSTRVLGADAAIHAHVAEDEMRVVADDRHPGVSGGEVQANDDDSCIRFQVPVFGGSRQRVRHGERPRHRQKDSEKVQFTMASRPRRHCGVTTEGCSA